ncbi:hypothetical protein FRC02_009417 [Tulasnella sp. 418]|nr:hypothetical protein FRC02_009417 [Tulasnella sp. 418]
MRPRGSTGAAPEEAIARPSSSQSNARYTNSRQPAPQHVDRVLSQRSSPVPSTNSLEDLASHPFQSSSPFYNPSSQSHAEQLSPVTPITGRVRKSTIHPGNRPAETSRHVGPGNATYSFSESRPPHSSGRTRLEHTNVSLSREMEDSGKLYGQFLRRGSQLSQAASIDADEPDDSGLGYNSSDADSERSSGKVGGDLLASGEGMLVPHGSTLRVKKKRTRTLPTSHQSAELNKLLSETPFPSTARREELGRRIGLSARKVQVRYCYHCDNI